MQSYLGLPFMTADEIDNSADPINIKIFKNLMDDLSNELQVVLITHDADSLSEYIQNERVSFTNLGTGGGLVEKPGK
jgi:chromosome segregation ATPase